MLMMINHHTSKVANQRYTYSSNPFAKQCDRFVRRPFAKVIFNATVNHILKCGFFTRVRDAS